MHHTPDQGRYQLFALLGEGGAARVWAGRLQGVARPFAFKFLHEDLLDSPMYRLRFEREATFGLAVSADHPNIVTTRGYDPDSPFGPLLILDLVGPPLDAVKQEFIGNIRAVRVVMQSTFAALAHIHSYGVVHRDVSGANLLVAPNGDILLSDFGLATRLDGTVTPGPVVGTIPYASPEVLGGDGGTTASDVFSAGALFYELVTGEPPFGTNRADIEAAITKGPPPLSRRLPRDVRETIQGMLQPQPKRRPSISQAARIVRPVTAAGTARFGMASERWLAAYCPTLVPALRKHWVATAPRPLKLRSSRWRPAAAAVGAVGVIAAGVTAMTLAIEQAPEPASAPAPAQSAVNVVDEADVVPREPSRRPSSVVVEEGPANAEARSRKRPHNGGAKALAQAMRRRGKDARSARLGVGTVIVSPGRWAGDDLVLPVEIIGDLLVAETVVDAESESNVDSVLLMRGNDGALHVKSAVRFAGETLTLYFSDTHGESTVVDAIKVTQRTRKR